jgi:hypothetical protein
MAFALFYKMTSSSFSQDALMMYIRLNAPKLLVFSWMEDLLKGCHLKNIVKVQAVLDDCIAYKHWYKTVVAEGQYFEGSCVQDLGAVEVFMLPHTGICNAP